MPLIQMIAKKYIELPLNKNLLVITSYSQKEIIELSGVRIDMPVAMMKLRIKTPGKNPLPHTIRDAKPMHQGGSLA